MPFQPMLGRYAPPAGNCICWRFLFAQKKNGRGDACPGRLASLPIIQAASLGMGGPISVHPKVH